MDRLDRQMTCASISASTPHLRTPSFSSLTYHLALSKSSPLLCSTLDMRINTLIKYAGVNTKKRNKNHTADGVLVDCCKHIRTHAHLGCSGRLSDEGGMPVCSGSTAP